MTKIKLFIFTAISIFFGSCSSNISQVETFGGMPIHGVRFDPSYYYNLKQPLQKFVDSSIIFWKSKGINTVYFKAYDPQFGAVYKTSYIYNHKTDYSNKDLLGIFSKACSENDMRLILWLPMLEHRGAWLAKPEWRYIPSQIKHQKKIETQGLLCFSNVEVQKWWFGFVEDILKKYPLVNGIDFAEPGIVLPNNTFCQCDICKSKIGTHNSTALPKEIERISAEFTNFISKSNQLVKKYNKTTTLTFIATVNNTGKLESLQKQKYLSGIDLPMLLNDEYCPDFICAEVLWQQWADHFDDPVRFTPDWTKEIFKELLLEIGHRSSLIAHVELTSLGGVNVTPQDLNLSVKAAKKAGIQSVEFYDTHIADSLQAWNEISKTWDEISEQQVYVFYDNLDGLGAARQIATLFGHFDLKTEIHPIDNYNDFLFTGNDFIVYTGTDEKNKLPNEFLKFVDTTQNKVLWVNSNLVELESLRSKGLNVDSIIHNNNFNIVLYKGNSLPKNDSIFTVLSLIDSAKVKVHAYAQNIKGESKPYMIQSTNFWYVADCPVDYMVEGGRHNAFADLIHEFVGQNHIESHTALVRIEDICALSDPKEIKKIADYLYSEKVSFSLAVVPFYVDPEENAVVSLSERPKLVKALKYAVNKGGIIVMHGSTHQYRGRTTGDYEFWDEIKNSPIFEDSKDHVRFKIERGLDEFTRCGLNPIIWETPHYGASQLDYKVIDQFFSFEYGRRQVIDQKGYDQLVPFLIRKHPDGIGIVPENCGYIPSDNQDPKQILTCSKNNLIVRDGFASFFFHPWIDLKVLKEIVKGLKKQGYRFGDIRNLPLSVNAPNYAARTTSGTIQINSTGKYVSTFFVDKNGKKSEEWHSQERHSSPFIQEINCPPGKMFVARTFDKARSWTDNLPLREIDFVMNIIGWIYKDEPIRLAEGQIPRVVILTNESEKELSSANVWKRELKACGIQPTFLDSKAFIAIPEYTNLLIVPTEASKILNLQQTSAIVQWVAKGNNILLEKGSVLATQLGIQTDTTHFVTNKIYDEFYTSVPLKIDPPIIVEKFTTTVENVKQYSSSNSEPVIVSGEYGEGSYIYSAINVTDSSKLKFFIPFLFDLLQRQFNLYPASRGTGLEIYFDPGNREDVSLEDLVRMWKRSGVTLVNVAGWEDYEGYTFEYDYFITLLHDNGINAYAWFELPHISDKFYKSHPSWHEQNAALVDSFTTWRRLINLCNDTIRAGSFNAIKKILMSGPWDGICLSGKIFEGDDPSKPISITPMNLSFRNAYEKTYGYDPHRIFEKGTPYSSDRDFSYWIQFCNARDSIEQTILIDFLKFVSNNSSFSHETDEFVINRSFLNSSRQMKIFYDEIVDSFAFVKLQENFDFTNEVDESYFDHITKSQDSPYSNQDQKLVCIDLDRVKTPQTLSTQLCGNELYKIVSKAIEKNIRLAIRTESSIYDMDFKNLPFALGSLTKVYSNDDVLSIESPNGCMIDIDQKNVKKVKLDGAYWPAYYKGRVIIPYGKHQISGMSRIDLIRYINSPEIRIFNGTIKSLKSTLKGIKISYTQNLPSPVILATQPKEILIDGVPVNKRDKKYGSEYNAIFELPKGNHDLIINKGSVYSALVKQASIGISGTIVFGSGIFIILFFILYIIGLYHKMRSNRINK